jgi:pimeloyl-ACP methyl ester carboxylesterase
MLPILLATLAATATPPATDCHIGAYKLADATTLDIGPGHDGSLRWRRIDGSSGELTHRGRKWLSTYGWTGRPDGKHIALTDCARGGGIKFEGVAGKRIAFDVQETTFTGDGGLKLAGRLVLPHGDDKVPIVVLVHGSESYSARIEDDMQRQLPAEGVGAFVYDKRGTGGSEGKYTQDYSTLANDAVAAVVEARRLAGARAGRVGFRGGSQGGWVAPLAATRTPVDFVMVGYGLAVSPLQEDREAIEYQMHERGYPDDIIAKALEISEAGGVMFESQFTRGFEDFERVRAKYRNEPWFKDVRGNFSQYLLELPPEQIREKSKVYAFGTPVRYDSMPVLRQLETPQLWMLGAEDEDAPSAETARRLESLRAQGKPITIAMFPRAAHGMRTFEKAKDGKRVATGYAEGYMRMTIDYARDGRLHGHYGSSTVSTPKP